MERSWNGGSIYLVFLRDYRNDLYRFLSDKQPDSIVLMNHGIGDGSTFNVDYAWPTDVITIERETEFLG